MFEIKIDATIVVHHHHYNDEGVQKLLAQGEQIMATQAELVAQVTAVNEKLTKIGTETTTLLAKIAELTAIIVAGPVTPEMQAAVDALAAQAQIVDDLVPDVVP